MPGPWPGMTTTSKLRKTGTMRSNDGSRTGGEILVDQLVAHGVQHVFCVPGESYLAALDAFHDRSVAITVCRQEGGAAMMAEAVGKATGKPGICFVTRGPGATNASPGIHIAMQDSTPMIEAVDAQFAEPTITPDDAALAFVAALLEDYADEWLNKAMFHYRWTYPEDQQSAAKRIVDMLFEGAETPEGVEETVRTRMVGRLHHVGSSSETAPVIEGSFTRLIALLEAMLKGRPYLFGGRPSMSAAPPLRERARGL